MHWWVLVCWFRSLYEFDGLANAQPVRHRRMELARSSPTPTDDRLGFWWPEHHLSAACPVSREQILAAPQRTWAHQNCSSGNAETREANVAAGGRRGRNEWNLVNTYSHGQSRANSIGPKDKQDPRADDRNLAQHWFLEKTLIYFHVGIQTQV